MADKDSIKSVRCMDEGTNKKLKGGVTGNILSANQTFHEMAFATSQKKQMTRVIILFFEIMGKLAECMVK